MNPLHEFAALFSNFGNIDPRMIVMWVVGGVLVYLAIKKEMEPTLLLPMGFGTILVNLPLSGAITQPGALTAARNRARYFDVLRKQPDGRWGVWRHLWQDLPLQAE